MAKIAVVFPGQGSQYLGMGQGFFDASQQAQELFNLAEVASGRPLRELCFQGPLDELTQTVNLQPAVIAVDLACWQALDTAGLKPYAVAGHSVGEYAALCAAGAFSPADCMRLVSLRGRVMDRDAHENPGAMSAVMGASPQEVAALCDAIDGVVQPANYNTPVQTVITGDKDAVADVGKLAKEKGFKAIPLKVSGAWHSPFMELAGKDMASAIEETEFSELGCLHVPNTTGLPTSELSLVKAELKTQLTAPVRWVQTVQALLEAGVTSFIEAGPKNVLAGLIKKTAPKGITVLSVQEPDDVEKTLAAL
jgi:[acyl-carrier-protein] S-malonyltransferase